MKLGAPYEDLVGAVQRALHPGAVVEVGQWIEGPDGERDIDVAVRGDSETGPTLIVVECKDYKRPVGIERVDALDSKRRDLNATAAILCSNSGFTSGALAKAQRVGIGAISVLATGDGRVHIKLTRLLFAESRLIQRFSLKVFPSDPDTRDIPSTFSHEDISFAGEPLANWLHEETRALISELPSSGEFTAAYEFEGPQLFAFGGASVLLLGMQLCGRFEHRWLGQRVHVDLTKGTFDHLRRRVTVPPDHRYIVGPIDQNAWKPLEDEPERPELQSGEFALELVLLRAIPAAGVGNVPAISAVVRSREVSFVRDGSGGAV